MKTKNLIVLIAVAAVLAVLAIALNSGSRPSAPKLNGKQVLPGLEVASVAGIECGKLKLTSKADGWVVDSYHGYPASREKLTENLLKLAELKVGQVARGRKLAKKETLKLTAADGAKVAELVLGEKHPKYGHGRYLEFGGETVLVSDALDAFEGEGKSWVETKIVDEPWISFNEVKESADEALTGLSTGIVAKVTIAGNTNRTITVGNVVKGGSDRYIKLDGSKWIYEVSSYSVDKFLPKPPAKEEKPKDEKPKAEPAKK